MIFICTVTTSFRKVVPFNDKLRIEFRIQVTLGPTLRVPMMVIKLSMALVLANLSK